MTRVLFLSNVPWDFIWQRHQTMASLWSERAEVDYVELPGVRRPRPGDMGRIMKRMAAMITNQVGNEPKPERVRVIKPWLFPASSVGLCALNARLLARRFGSSPQLCGPYDVAMVYSPIRTSLQWLDRVRCGRVVYDCTDDLTAVGGVPSFFRHDEELLLKRADLTLVPSRVLLGRKQSLARRIMRLPHGAWVERFKVHPRRARNPEDCTALYYGHLHRQHLDFDALERLARDRPRWRLVLVGPVRTSHGWPANVILPGQVPHGELRVWIDQADVLLLPYVLNRYTEAVMPAKTYECLATGRPIVATPLPELAAGFSDCMDFVTPGGDWAPAIQSALARDHMADQQRRIRIAESNAWSCRFEELQTALGPLDESGRQ